MKKYKNLLILLLVAIIIILTLFIIKNKDYDNSFIYFFLNGKWEKGFNFYSFLAIALYILAAQIVINIIRMIQDKVINSRANRNETLIRLIFNIIRYAIIFICFFGCLGAVGINTGGLLASAGVITIIVGFGAQSLIGDILAGLFIILEEAFKVGDIIMVDNFRGTVVEIGIRTTRIMDDGKNVKIINNSQINNIVNMTKQDSYAAVDFGIGYDEPLDRVEAVLNKELPLMHAKIPGILEGPFYKGVEDLGDSSVTLKIIVKCNESERLQVTRDLRREIKLMCDRNDINIPYPQLVVHGSAAGGK